MTGGWPIDDLRCRARALEDAATATAGVVTSLAEAWADATGQEWAERLRVVVRELDRLAADASARTGGSDRPAGVVLGAQSGSRVTTRRGVVVPTLPPP